MVPPPAGVAPLFHTRIETFSSSIEEVVFRQGARRRAVASTGHPPLNRPEAVLLWTLAMKKIHFQEALAGILARDPRYAEDAYHFVREALDFTIKLLDKPQEGPGRHVTGQELLEGIRQYALKEYGQMALRVLNTWGIHKTEDFGEIVFNMVEAGILGKTEEDKKEDFHGGYDFETAFVRPFLPLRKLGRLPKAADARN